MLSFLRETLETIAIALAVFLALHLSIQNFRVEGASMQPTFREGQYLLVNKLIYFHWDLEFLKGILPISSSASGGPLYLFHSPQRGEVIVFHFPRDRSRDFIKRVIGTPGDQIEIRQGRVYINGDLMEEPYAFNKGNSSMRPTKVTQDSYFVLGDNRTSSNDSRDWGLVSRRDIIGKAWLTYWPSDRVGFIPGYALESARPGAR